MDLKTLGKIYEVTTLHAGPPVIYWGQPGVGKTRAIEGWTYLLSKKLKERDIAKGMHILTLIPSIRDPSDFNGLPIVVKSIDGLKSTTFMAPPQWAQQSLDWVEAGYWVKIFLDEMSNAPPAVQAAGLRGIQDGIWGDIQLPKKVVSYCGAANPPDEAASGWELTAPMANRLMHEEWINDPMAWVEGMAHGWPGEPEIGQEVRSSRIHVAAFIRARPHLLHMMPKEEAARGMAWPSNRTWCEAADMLAACKLEGADQDVEAFTISGLVGNGVGMEFLNWQRALDLPEAEDILKDPDNWKWPDRGDQQFAVLAAVAQAVISSLGKGTATHKKDRWNRGWKAFSYAAKKGAKDVAAIAVRELAKHRSDDLPVPTKELEPFMPLLKSAGLV